jgi:hypothetical protein
MLANNISWPRLTASVSPADTIRNRRCAAGEHLFRRDDVMGPSKFSHADAILIRCRRDGRVAEGARLESVFTLTGNLGSNPSLSAIPFSQSTENTRIGQCLFGSEGVPLLLGLFAQRAHFLGQWPIFRTEPSNIKSRPARPIGRSISPCSGLVQSRKKGSCLPLETATPAAQEWVFLPSMRSSIENRYRVAPGVR